MSILYKKTVIISRNNGYVENDRIQTLKLIHFGNIEMVVRKK
jgi:hypothetical protein